MWVEAGHPRVGGKGDPHSFLRRLLLGQGGACARRRGEDRRRGAFCWTSTGQAERSVKFTAQRSLARVNTGRHLESFCRPPGGRWIAMGGFIQFMNAPFGRILRFALGVI